MYNFNGLLDELLYGSSDCLEKAIKSCDTLVEKIRTFALEHGFKDSDIHPVFIDSHFNSRFGSEVRKNLMADIENGRVREDNLAVPLAVSCYNATLEMLGMTEMFESLGAYFYSNGGVDINLYEDGLVELAVGDRVYDAGVVDNRYELDGEAFADNVCVLLDKAFNKTQRKEQLMTTLEHFDDAEIKSFKAYTNGSRGMERFEIEHFCEYLDNIMDDSGLSEREINDTYAAAVMMLNQRFESGDVTRDNYSVELMRCLSHQTACTLLSQFPNEDFYYEVNSLTDAHLTANGERFDRYEKIDDYLNAHIDFTHSEIVDITNVCKVNDTTVRCQMTVPDDLANKLILRADYGDKTEDVANCIEAGVEFDVDVRICRTENDVSVLVVLPDESLMGEVALTSAEKDALMRLTNDTFVKGMSEKAKDKTKPTVERD